MHAMASRLVLLSDAPEKDGPDLQRGLHLSFNMSRQMRPSLSTFGW